MNNRVVGLQMPVGAGALHSWCEGARMYNRIVWRRWWALRETGALYMGSGRGACAGSRCRRREAPGEGAVGNQSCYTQMPVGGAAVMVRRRTNV